MTQMILDDSERVGAWVAERVDQSASWGDFYALGVERDGQIVAGIVFNNHNGVNATCHVAIDKPGKYIIALMKVAADYAFNFCKLKRITGMVPASKPHVLAFDLNLGWEEEFVMQDAAHDGGPLHILVMRPETCRWLKGN